MSWSPAPPPADLLPVVVEHVSPAVDGGRFPVKRTVGEVLTVEADIFMEGHGVLRATLQHRGPGQRAWCETPMEAVGNDRWRAAIRLNSVGCYRYRLVAWPSWFRSWQQGVAKKLEAGVEVASEIADGCRLLADAAARAGGPDRAELEAALDEARRLGAGPEAAGLLLNEELANLVDAHSDAAWQTIHDPGLEVVVDEERARFAAWYEMFPRSQGTDPTRSATFKEAAARLEDIAGMGFDVVYLPPIHPIGHTGRKGRNNSLPARPGDPGSPWAIGDESGGHKAIHPDLGTMADFEAFAAEAGRLGLEVALDYAIQCSPDHPYIREHPEWFHHRADGSIRYAENPPKKYEDIYPLNLYCQDRQALWEELKSILLFWISHGIKTFRVDNPHTKPLPFWEWLIREIKAEHPEVVFLAEAFTRPRVMHYLAKAGFTQSYTYFTWRTTAEELREYLTELTQPPVSDYFRGNLFVNTPDILHEVLQTGGRPAFQARLVLAATLSSLYGMYSGFELLENTPLRAGSEEYLDSEKYQYKARDWDKPGNIKAYVRQVNAIRRENPALQYTTNLRFQGSDNPDVLAYAKAAGENVILVAVNLDAVHAHEANIMAPLDYIGAADGDAFGAEELLSGGLETWDSLWRHIRLDPQDNPCAIWRLSRA